MRQVDLPELSWIIQHRLGRLSTTLRNNLASRDAKVRDLAEHMIADMLAKDGFDRLEVLSNAPAPPGFWSGNDKTLDQAPGERQ